MLESELAVEILCYGLVESGTTVKLNGEEIDVRDGLFRLAKTLDQGQNRLGFVIHKAGKTKQIGRTIYRKAAKQ